MREQVTMSYFFSRRFGALATLVALAACSGGGSSAPVAPVIGGAPAGPAVFQLGFVVAPGLFATAHARAPRSARAPRYVSAGTRSVAAYDGATLIYVGNLTTSPPFFTTVFDRSGTTTVTAGTCAATNGGELCSLTVSTTAGAHRFDVVTYPVPQGEALGSVRRAPADIGTAPGVFNGVILSEGELAVTLVSGNNPDQVITPLGVADAATFGGAPAEDVSGADDAAVGVIGTPTTLSYEIDDASGKQIVQPGDYDNGPVTIVESDGNGIVTMTTISQSSPPASAGPQTFSVTCAKTGTATITATAKTKPNTTYASGLTYSPTNYSSGTLGSTTLQCEPGSATLPITVNSTKGRK
jgi:hypothetical protein